MFAAFALLFACMLFHSVQLLQHVSAAKCRSISIFAALLLTSFCCAVLLQHPHVVQDCLHTVLAESTDIYRSTVLPNPLSILMRPVASNSVVLEVHEAAG